MVYFFVTKGSMNLPEKEVYGSISFLRLPCRLLVVSEGFWSMTWQPVLMAAQAADEFKKSKVESPEGTGGIYAMLPARRHVYVNIFY